MNRRDFIALTAVAAGCGAVGIAPAACALERNQLAANSGRTVRLEGWLTPASEGPGHFLTLTRGRGAARSVYSLADCDAEAVRVLPQDTRHVRPGRVRLEGQLQVGHFVDQVTGQVSAAILMNARTV